MKETKIAKVKKSKQIKHEYLVILDFFFRIISKYKITICRNIFNLSKRDF